MKTTPFVPKNLSSEIILHGGVRAFLNAQSFSTKDLDLLCPRSIREFAGKDVQFKEAKVSIIIAGPDRRYNNDVEELCVQGVCVWLEAFIDCLARLKAMSEASFPGESRESIRAGGPSGWGGSAGHLICSLKTNNSTVWLEIGAGIRSKQIKAFSKDGGVAPEFVSFLRQWEAMALQIKSMYEAIEGKDMPGQGDFSVLPGLAKRLESELALFKVENEQEKSSKSALPGHIDQGAIQKDLQPTSTVPRRVGKAFKVVLNFIYALYWALFGRHH